MKHTLTLFTALLLAPLAPLHAADALSIDMANCTWLGRLLWRRCMIDRERLHELCRLRSTLEAFAVRCWPLGAGREHLEPRVSQPPGRIEVTGGGRSPYEAFHAADREFHRAAVEGRGLAGAVGKLGILVSLELDAWILEVKQSDLAAPDGALPRARAAASGVVRRGRRRGGTGDAPASGGRLAPGHDGGPRGSGSDPSNAPCRSSPRITIARSTWLGWRPTSASVSPSHLGRLFRQRLQVSPRRHLKQVRLERAAQLLCSAPMRWPPWPGGWATETYRISSGISGTCLASPRWPTGDAVAVKPPAGKNVLLRAAICQPAQRWPCRTESASAPGPGWIDCRHEKHRDRVA